MQRARQTGFSLFELIIVIVLIGYLAAKSLEYYNDAADDARRAGIESLARSLTAAISGAHGEWLLKGGRSQGPASRVDMDGTFIVLNSGGWPIGIEREGQAFDAASALHRCADLWVHLLQNPPAYSLKAQDKGKQRYHLEELPGQGCRFIMSTQTADTHYLDYLAKNGRLLVHVPIDDDG